MYIAKCYNRPYMAKKLGDKVPWFKKIAMGASLMLFILFLIAGPMLLFSSINPVGQANPVSRASLSFYFTIDEAVANTHSTIPIFYTE